MGIAARVDLQRIPPAFMQPGKHPDLLPFRQQVQCREVRRIDLDPRFWRAFPRLSRRVLPPGEGGVDAADGAELEVGDWVGRVSCELKAERWKLRAES